MKLEQLLEGVSYTLVQGSLELDIEDIPCSADFLIFKKLDRAVIVHFCHRGFLAFVVWFYFT